MLRSAVAALAVACLALPSLAGAQDLPRRKSGLWEITMDSPQRASAAAAHPGMPAKLTMTQCVDQARDDAFRQAGEQFAREMKCTRSSPQRGPGSLLIESSCDLGGTKSRSKTLVTGDFNSKYKMEVHTTYDPPLMGKSERTMTMEAKWVGACKPGQRPGDTTMPGGMTMNMYDVLDVKK